MQFRRVNLLLRMCFKLQSMPDSFLPAVVKTLLGLRDRGHDHMALDYADGFVSRRSFRPQAPTKHLLSAETLTPDYIDEICELAENFEFGFTEAEHPRGTAVALLFFQPSTRTRLGFEVATAALGCHAVGLGDMAGSRSNARTGETLEDCGAVVSNLCDAIVLRHHDVGAAARIATKSRKPVINAGDGWNEHPTQALIDLHSMRRNLGTIKGRSIAFCGDPRGRTVRSLVHLLRFELPSEVVFCAPEHVPVPEDVLNVLSMSQIRFRFIDSVDEALRDCDAIMMAPYDMSDIGEQASSDYVSPRISPDTHVINAAKIHSIDSQSLIFHPLPRQDEIHPDCDDLPNARYFEQVRLSKYVRMAVLNRALR